MLSDKLPDLKKVEATAEEEIYLENFRNEISELKEKREKKEIDIMYELLSIDLNELTTADADIWYKVNNYEKGLVTPESLDIYRQDVKNSKSDSRFQFRAIIFSKLSIIWGKEGRENLEKQKKPKNEK